MDDAKTVVEAMVQQYADGIWRYVYASTKKREVADDITQDVFMQAYIHLSEFRHESTIKTWLFSIARNKCRDYFRSTFFRKVDLYSTVDITGTQHSAEQQAVQNANRNEIVDIILKLPKHQREVVVLRLQEDMTFSEIAKLLGGKESTIRVRYKRALQTIRVSLQEEMVTLGT